MQEYTNDEEYQKLQAKFYETGEAKYLWEAYPLIEHAVRSALRMYIEKETGNPDTPIPNWHNKVEDGTLYFIQRCIKGYNRMKSNPNTKLGRPINCSLVTYCYWIAKLMMSTQRIDYERQQSFEDNCLSLEETWL